MRASHLDPGVDGAELVDELRPLVNHLNDLMLLHEWECDVGPGVETHDLTGRQQGAPRQHHTTTQHSMKCQKCAFRRLEINGGGLAASHHQGARDKLWQVG